MKVSEVLAKAAMKPVPKARNLGQVAQVGGYMVVQFKGRSTLYIYGPNVDVDTAERLLTVPYPDKLFTQWRDKYGWQCMKVNRAA